MNGGHQNHGTFGLYLPKLTTAYPINASWETMGAKRTRLCSPVAAPPKVGQGNTEVPARSAGRLRTRPRLGDQIEQKM